MAPLKSISDRAAEIEATAPTGGGVAPGLAEQRTEQVARFEEGAANGEFVTLPAFYSFPSASLFPLFVLTVLSTTSVRLDPPARGAKHASVCTTLNRPFSRGTIHATSPDPLAPPEIDPHYFEEDIGMKPASHYFQRVSDKGYK